MGLNNSKIDSDQEFRKWYVNFIIKLGVITAIPFVLVLGIAIGIFEKIVCHIGHK